MPHPATDLYLGVPGWICLWFLATVAFFAVLLKLWQYGSTLAEGRREARSDRPVERIRIALRAVFGQKRRRDERVLGLAVLVLIWAVSIHAAAFVWNVLRGTVVVSMTSIFPEKLPPYTDQVPAVRWGLAVVAALGLTALLLAAISRYVFTPVRLKGRHRLSLTPVLVGIVFLSSIAGVFNRYGYGATEAIWWIETASMFALLAYVAFSRDNHMVFAPVAAFSAPFDRDRVPPPSRGAVKVEEFTWHELLAGLACGDCGRCETVCPARNDLKTGSPRNMMRTLRETIERRSDRQLVSLEHLWSCDTCAACMEVCPAFNEHVPLIIEMRRAAVLEGRIPPEIGVVFENLRRTGNRFGLPPGERAKWTDQLGFEIPDARQRRVEYLWVVGDHASFHPLAINATRSAARVLHRAGIDFGILYESECNVGNDVRRAGAEELYEWLAAENLRAFRAARFEKVITTDPHTYNVLKNEFPWNGVKPAVLHLSEVMARLLRTGRPPVVRELTGGVVYHDPCYLGRYNGVYEPPRKILGEIGLAVIELPDARGSAACCGGGGGRIASVEAGAGTALEPARAILREAAAKRGACALAVACPKDLILLKKAAADSGFDSNLEIRDVAEFLDEATRPADGAREEFWWIGSVVH